MVLPSSVISLHGIEVDTVAMQLRLPHDKVVVARQKLQSLYHRKKASLHDIRSLLSTLAFACRTIVASRCFLRRLYDLISARAIT